MLARSGGIGAGSETAPEIEAGVQFAINAPYPDKSEVDQDVYA